MAFSAVELGGDAVVSYIIAAPAAIFPALINAARRNKSVLGVSVMILFLCKIGLMFANRH